MALSEKEISELFPNGAVEGKKGWQPAEKVPDRTLKRLLRDKKERIQKPRLLATSGTHRLRWDKKLEKWIVIGGSEDQDKGYTDVPGLAMSGPDAGEAVDEVTQTRFTQEARMRRSEDRQDEVIDMQARIIANKIAKLQREGMRFGVDLGPAFQKFIKDSRDEIVQQRRSAA